MSRPPLVAPYLARCPSCCRPFKGRVDLRVEPPSGRMTCPWCLASVLLISDV
ncbi:hypothetical protein [Euzebya tangerina]|uniref:hypothetical protein n=1 Tax=Euzebya tangerina TaxID=591198 RepID=UPI0013C2F563|nr:hypothetical protein [Euzebya tangerina]